MATAYELPKGRPVERPGETPRTAMEAFLWRHEPDDVDEANRFRDRLERAVNEAIIQMRKRRRPA